MTYRTCNSTVRFSKYEFYNKLLGGIILLRVTCNSTVRFSKYEFYNKLLGGIILLRVAYVTLSNIIPPNNLL